MIAQLSNLALQLYSWYVKYGHAANEKDETGVKQFFREHLPANAYNQTGFYERFTSTRVTPGMPLSGRTFCSITLFSKMGRSIQEHPE